jgi:hypothetical protein
MRDPTPSLSLRRASPHQVIVLPELGQRRSINGVCRGASCSARPAIGRLVISEKFSKDVEKECGRGWSRRGLETAVLS